MKKIAYFLFIIIFCFSVSLKAQNALKSFQWRDHLPYSRAFSVTNQGNTIYAVSNECIFSFNKDDNSYNRLNKVTGLSDIEPVIVKNNPYNNTLLVLYKNSNIDVIKNGNITNVPDLLRKQNLGNKVINNVTFNAKLAYLACGFGIAVFNTESLEFQDTYIIGPGGSNLNVFQVALDLPNHTIYAATAKGIYFASLNSSNLASYTNWQQVTSLPNPNDTYNAIVYFAGNIIASYSWNLTQNQNAGSSFNDTLYKFDGTTWSKNPFYTVGGFTKLAVSDNKKQLLVIDHVGFVSYDTLANATPMDWGAFPGYDYATYSTADVIPDPTEAGWFWEANSSYGLFKLNNVNVKPQVFTLSGPTLTNCAQIQIKDDKVIAASSFLGYKQAPNYLTTGVYVFHNDVWSSDITPPTDTLYDIDCVAFDNNDKNHYYAGSFGNGVAEVQNGVRVALYNHSNTPEIPTRNFPNNNQSYVTSIYPDIDNNIWIATNDNPSFISVKKNDGHWENLNFSNLVPNIQYLNITQLIVDSNNLTWATGYGTGLFVYKNDGTYSQPNASNSKLLVNLAGKGGLPSVYPVCLAQDKNRDIWVGTDQGIYVFYNPESIFTQSSGWDAQPIYVQQDGQTQLLLQTDNVSTIFVDGANNKWVGTTSSGLYYFSPDGQTQLYHFTADNSPLFSNNVVNVTVNSKTGEVFIATDKGVQSFQNITTEGLTNFDDVYAYPNPVKPGYNGPILIHGMVSGASVKIVDAAGNFVFETTSEGGQAVWNGQNFKGQRVASGIYMAICATPDGSQKKLTKILLLN